MDTIVSSTGIALKRGALESECTVSVVQYLLDRHAHAQEGARLCEHIDLRLLLELGREVVDHDLWKHEVMHVPNHSATKLKEKGAALGSWGKPVLLGHSMPHSPS